MVHLFEDVIEIFFSLEAGAVGSRRADWGPEDCSQAQAVRSVPFPQDCRPECQELSFPIPSLVMVLALVLSPGCGRLP